MIERVKSRVAALVEGTRRWYNHSSPDDASAREVIAYAAGGVGAGLPGAAITGLTMLIMNVELGVPPQYIGLVLSAFIVWDAVNDPVFAHITDNTRSRWGRRRPYIAIGGIWIGLLGIATWMMPAGMGMLNVTVGPWSLSIAKSLIWFGVCLFLMDIGTTVFMVPYYALGIELSPTYDGRTRVAAWRSLLGGVAGMVSPWFYRFCLIAVFGGVLYGARVLMVILAVVAGAAGIYTAAVCKERTHMDTLRKRKKESFFSAVRGCARSWHFWRITIIYVIMLFIGPLFEQFGAYVSLWYVFKGDKVFMATLGGYVGMLGTAMGMAGIAIFTRVSNKFGKHNALRTAVILFIIGHILKLVLYNPACPYLLILTPFIFSIGIAATFTILSAMQADIVDVDEIVSGQRREGMFGAVASVVMKSSGALATGIAGFLVAMTGYNVDFGANQPPGTFTAMRLLFSLGPVPFLLVVLALLRKYPFDKKRMDEIHQELKRRHAVPAAEPAGGPAPAA